MRVMVPLLVLHQRVEYVLSGRAALFIISATVVVCGSAALAVLDAERDAGDPNITSLRRSAVVGSGDHHDRRVRRQISGHRHRDD